MFVIAKRPKFDKIKIQRAEPISLAERNSIENVDLGEVTLKKELKNVCEIYSKGPICLGSGARLITKAANLEGVVADFQFDERIVSLRAYHWHLFFKFLTGILGG